ncbi:MAG: hypothetical protein ACR2O4_03830, partial [Hyphomicrobiaceae bacterium]
RYDGLGLSFSVVLVGAARKESCGVCGRLLGYGIRNLPGLRDAAAVTRALHPLRLSGEDIRFLRKALKWKAIELADWLDVTPEHLSRCENNKEPLSAKFERFLRLTVCTSLGDPSLLKRWALDELRNMKLEAVVDPSDLEFRFHLVSHDEIEARLKEELKEEKEIERWGKAA